MGHYNDQNVYYKIRYFNIHEGTLKGMNPFKYQQKLIEEAKVSNEEAQIKLIEAIKDGYHITAKSLMVGPYISYISYWISNGTMVVVNEPSSLHWVQPDIYVY